MECTRCKDNKPAADFYKGRSQCKACIKAITAARYRDNPDYRARAIERAQGRYKADPTAAIDYQKARYHRLRAGAVAAYGGACVLCGSTDRLEFDHVHGGGEEHRRREAMPKYIRRAAQTGRPLDDVELRILCHPCHVTAGYGANQNGPYRAPVVR